MWFWLAILAFVCKAPFLGVLFLIFWIFSGNSRRR